VAIGFIPDGYDNNAPFLSRKVGTYIPKDTGNLDNSGKYKVLLGEDGEEVLLPHY